MLVWNAHKTKVRYLTFSPDGRTLASAAEKAATVYLWEPSSGKALGELRGKWGFISGITFSPNGELIATTTMNHRAVIWDAAKRVARSAPSTLGFRYAPAFAPDGGCIAVGGWGGAAVWSAPAAPHPETLGSHDSLKWEPDEKLTFQSAASAADTFDSLAFSPDGTTLAAQGIHSAVLWDQKENKVKRVFHHASETDTRTVLTFSPDGARLALGFEKNAEIRAVRGRAKTLKLAGHKGVVRAVGFTPDGRTAMTAAGDGVVRFWDASTGALVRAFDWGVGKLYSAAFSPDGLMCAAGGESGQVVIWDVDA